MKTRTLGDRWSPLNGRRLAPWRANALMSAPGTKRYDRYRASFDDQRVPLQLPEATNSMIGSENQVLDGDPKRSHTLKA